MNSLVQKRWLFVINYVSSKAAISEFYEYNGGDYAMDFVRK
jgi:hypothetical protein